MNCLIDKSNIVFLFPVSNSTFLGIYHKPLGNFLENFLYIPGIYLYKINIMKKLPTNQLFDIFEKGDEEIYREHGVENLLDNTYILFGMVVRGVENFYIIDQLYATRYGEQYYQVKDSIKLKYFSGLMGYLERIKDLPIDLVPFIEDEFDKQSIHYAFNELMDLFIEVEYYEKCVILKKYFELFSIKQLEVSE